MSTASARPNSAVLWLTIFAAPVALGFETLLRKLLFPADFELVREFFRPMLTPVAWGIAGLVGLAALGGLGLQHRLTTKRLAALPADADLGLRFRTAIGVFLLTTSIPQIPTILSTFSFMFGASLTPVLAGIAICSVGVVSQAVRARRFAEHSTDSGNDS